MVEAVRSQTLSFFLFADFIVFLCRLLVGTIKVVPEFAQNYVHISVIKIRVLKQLTRLTRLQKRIIEDP